MSWCRLQIQDRRRTHQATEEHTKTKIKILLHDIRRDTANTNTNTNTNTPKKKLKKKIIFFLIKSIDYYIILCYNLYIR